MECQRSNSHILNTDWCMLPASLRCFWAPLVLGIDCYDDSVISARYEARILFATRGALPCSAALLRSTFVVRARHVLQYQSQSNNHCVTHVSDVWTECVICSWYETEFWFPCPLPMLMRSMLNLLNEKQALRNSCELLRQRKELHTSSWNCMQAHGTSCKLIKLYESSGTACQLW